LHPSAVATVLERGPRWRRPWCHWCRASWLSAVCPTGRAKKCVDVKSAPYAKHTTSRTSWLHTRKDSKTCQSIFSWKLTKDKVVKFQSLELAGWYQIVPYLRLESQVRWHIAIESYLPAN
jgi:hypothetical protein